MLLQFTDGEPFATGAAPYAYRPATEGETSPRVLITVSLGNIETSAIVDTGGVFLFCSPEVALQIDFDPSMGIPTPRLLWRGTWHSGALHRVPLTMRADEGGSLTIEATAFIPELALGEELSGEFPCILGMSGCLERLRLAIDPSTDTFYFGELARRL